MDGPKAPPGWYEDPDDPGFEREWNGSEWTGARRAVPTPTDEAAQRDDTAEYPADATTPYSQPGEPAAGAAGAAGVAGAAAGASAGAAVPSPGWYPDPETPETERWWDGAAWTDARRAMAPEAVPFYTRPWFLILLAVLVIALVVWALTRSGDEGDDAATTTVAADTTTSVDTTAPAETTTTTAEETTTTAAEETTTTTAEETTTTAAEETTTTAAVEREPVFGAGRFEVGVDIAPGVYETGEIDSGFLGLGGGCTWQRLADDSGDESSVIAERTVEGHEVVELLDGDGFFDSSDCGEWYELEELDEPLSPIPTGTWVVGVHIQPGTYQAPGGGDCTWERLSDGSRDPDSIIDSAESADEPTVEILESDFAFSSVGCGEWSQG